MDYWFIAYLLICFAIAGTFLRMFATSGQTTAAVLSTLLLVAIFVFYGLRWFKDSELKGTSAAGGVAWPPIVNACPDFMVTYTNTNGTYCYDAGKIYNLTSLTAGTTTTALVQSVAVNGTGTQAEKVLLANNPAGSDNASKFPLMNAFKQNTYQSLVDGTMLKWEGVWDGINVTK